MSDYQHSQPQSWKKLDNLIRSVEREIELRRKVYPNRVIQNKMTEGHANYEINCMKEVLMILKILERTDYLTTQDAETSRIILENTKPHLKV